MRLAEQWSVAKRTGGLPPVGSPAPGSAVHRMNGLQGCRAALGSSENLPPRLAIMQVLFSRQTGGYSTVSCPCQLDRKEGEEPAGFPRDCGLCLARVSAAGAVEHIHPSTSTHPAFLNTCAGCSRTSSA